jgi:metal-responsive CopG/Arc/MetJ family transcriptional regulator
MKAITVRLSEDELHRLHRIKAVGFSTISEVIRCAVLSLVESAERGQSENNQDAKP